MSSSEVQMSKYQQKYSKISQKNTPKKRPRQGAGNKRRGSLFDE